MDNARSDDQNVNALSVNEEVSPPPMRHAVMKTFHKQANSCLADRSMI